MTKIEDLGQIEGKTLVPLDKYLESGVHIGSKFRTGDMRKFIYKCRNDGLCVLDVGTLDNRIATAAKFLARFEPSKIIVVAGRAYAKRPAQQLSDTIGATAMIDRFIPGTLTNPSNDIFSEPEAVFISDPSVDRQVVKEAVKAKIPVLSLCDTSNQLRNIDLVVPMNNKGKKALALVYWLLTREILKERKVIENDKDFKLSVDDFEAKIIAERPTKKKEDMKPRNNQRARRRK